MLALHIKFPKTTNSICVMRVFMLGDFIIYMLYYQFQKEPINSGTKDFKAECKDK